MRDGTRLGTIALCAHCKFAIELRRARWQANGRWNEIDFWFHFRPPMTPHTAAPCEEVGAPLMRRHQEPFNN